MHFSIIYTLSLCGRLLWVEWTPGLFNGEGLLYDSYPENYFIQHSGDFRNAYGLLERSIKKIPRAQTNKIIKDLKEPIPKGYKTNNIGPENAHTVHLNNPIKQLNLWKPRELEGGKREKLLFSEWKSHWYKNKF